MNCIAITDEGKNCPNPVKKGEKLCTFHKNQKDKKTKNKILSFLKCTSYVAGGVFLGVVGYRGYQKFQSNKKS